MKPNRKIKIIILLISLFESHAVPKKKKKFIINRRSECLLCVYDVCACVCVVCSWLARYMTFVYNVHSYIGNIVYNIILNAKKKKTYIKIAPSLIQYIETVDGRQ